MASFTPLDSQGRYDRPQIAPEPDQELHAAAQAIGTQVLGVA